MLRVEAKTRLGALDLDVALSAGGGRCLALAGPSGAGKSSLLRVIAGLLRPSSGRVECGGSVWLDTTTGVNLPPEERRCGYVFQDYALFPHLSAWRNVAYPLHHLSRAHREEPGQAGSSEWETRHKDFHMALIAGCGSRWIERISAQLFDAAERYRLLALEQVLERNELQEHRDLVDACINREPDRALALLDHHYTQTFEAITNSHLDS